MLRNKRILLISPEPWDHIFVSKHHYAANLGELGNKVYFLNPPGEVVGIKATGYSNVYEVNYRGFFRGLRFCPAFFQRKCIANVYSKLTHLCSTEFDLVWSFDNSVFFDFDALPESIIKVSHIVDLNQDFQTEKAARTADYCFCTTELIRKRLLRFNRAVIKINHGFNPSDFSAPIMLPGKSKTKVVYSGNLAMPFIDWILLSQVIRNHKEVDFIFIGPNSNVFNSDRCHDIAKREVLELSNAYFVGKVAAFELSGYYAAADILIVSYQERYHPDQASPHKLMEYLGSGKVVVATYSDEYRDLLPQRLLAMCKSNDDFPKLFCSVLLNLTCWNAPDKQSLRRKFSLENTYLKQIRKIESILDAGEYIFNRQNA